MKDFIKESGKNAGKVWQAINRYGPLSKTMLIKTTHLDEEAFCLAVGWLARENKIWNDKHRYGLGETNLTNTIGNNAGKIWEALEAWGQIDITSIARLAEIPVKDAYSALGWLAREDKIQLMKSSKKTGKPTITLK